MLAGELHRSTDLALQAALAQAQQLRRLNSIAREDTEQRFAAALQAMLGQIGNGTQISNRSLSALRRCPFLPAKQ
jgi:Maltose acetyltransferase